MRPSRAGPGGWVRGRPKRPRPRLAGPADGALLFHAGVARSPGHPGPHRVLRAPTPAPTGRRETAASERAEPDRHPGAFIWPIRRGTGETRPTAGRRNTSTEA